MMENLFSRVSFMAIFLSLFPFTLLNAHSPTPDRLSADAQLTLQAQLSDADLFYPGQFNFEHSGFVNTNSENFKSWSVPLKADGFFLDFFAPVSDCYVNYEPPTAGTAFGNLAGGLIFAVDFPVGAGETLDLEYINFKTVGDANTYTVALFENNPSGGPGTMIGTPFTVTPVYQKNFLSSNAFEVRLDVSDQNISLSGGTAGKMYWISLTSTAGPRFGYTYWLQSETVHNGTGFYYSSNYSTWTEQEDPPGTPVDGSLRLNCEDPDVSGDCETQSIPSWHDDTVYYQVFGGPYNDRHSIRIPVGDSSFTVNGMSINILVDPDSDPDLDFNIILMEDFQGVPGNVLTSTGVTVNCGGFLTTMVSGDIFMSYKIEFDNAFHLDADTAYWIEVQCDAVGWEVNPDIDTGKISAFLADDTNNTWILSETQFVYSLICGEVGSNCFDNLSCTEQGIDISETNASSFLTETNRLAVDIPVLPGGFTFYGISAPLAVDSGITNTDIDFELILYESTKFGLPAAEIGTFSPRIGGVRDAGWTASSYPVFEFDLYVDNGIYLEGDKVYWLEVQSDSNVHNWLATTNTQVGNGLGYLIPENQGWNIQQGKELIYSLICTPPPADMCEWTVHVWDDYTGEEVVWQLREQDTDRVILEGKDYSGPEYDITETILSAGPVRFAITSANGTVGDNEPNYTVSNENAVLAAGKLEGGETVIYEDLACDMPYGPVNDDSCNAIDIDCDETISGSTSGASDSGLPTDCEWTTIKSDLWYKFDADGTSDYIVSLTDTNSSDMLVSVYSGDCNALTEVDCTDDYFSGTESVTLNAPAAGTYYIRVVTYDADAEFDLTLECLEAEEDCLNQNEYMTVSAPTTPDPVTIATCSWAGDYNVVTDAVAGSEYTFTATGGDGNYLTIREGTYDGPVIGQGDSPVTVTATQNGNLYVHLNTDDDCGTDTTCHTMTVACSSCTVEAPVNDDSCDAISIDCDETISGNTTGATDSGLPTDCEWTTIESDVWYKFDADGTSDYTVSLTDTNDSDMLLSVYSGTCDALTEVDCMDDYYTGTEEVSLSAPAAGTYYIRVVTYVADAEFDLTLECIGEGDDDCLNLNEYMTVPAPTTPDPVTIATCSWAGDYNVVTDAVAGSEYTFTATGGDGNYLTIREGTYDGPVIGQGDSPVTVTATQNGNLYVHLNTDDDCGTDTTCHTVTAACSSCTVEAPVNDDSCDAINIDCNETISGTTTGASDSGLPTDCEWTTIESDVWYKFDADGISDYTVSLTDTNDSDMLLSVYSGECDALTEVDCMDDWYTGTEEVSLSAPAAGTYYIRVVTYVADAEFDLTLECIDDGGGTDDCWQGIPSVDDFLMAWRITLGQDFRVAEDFTVPEGTAFIVNQLTFDTNNEEVPDYAVINIREDNGEEPGAILHTIEMEPTSWEEIGFTLGDPIYKVVFDLEEPIEFGEGMYWIDPQMSIPNGGDVWWGGTNLHEDGLTPRSSSDNGATWTEFISLHMAFTVSGYCETLGMGDLSGFDFSYYPNPVRDVLHINSAKKVENVRVFNLVGQEVMPGKKIIDGELDLTGLTTGAYVFRVTLEGGRVETFKIIKR